MYNSPLVNVFNSPLAVGYAHYGVIDQNGQLSMVGKNDDGQLGNGTTQDSKIPVPISLPSKVVSIACSISFTGAVTENGQTYFWGREPMKDFQVIYSGYGYMLSSMGPVLATELKDKFVVKITAPGHNSGYGVVLSDGSAFFKLIDPVKKKILSDTIRINPGIVEIQIGYRTVVLLTNDGKIYTFGKPFLPKNSKYVPTKILDNIYLGLNNLDQTPTINPALIPFEKTVQHFSVSDRLMVLTTEGEIFDMNSYGDDGPNVVYMLDAMSPGKEPDRIIGGRLMPKRVYPDLPTALKESKPKRIPLPEKISSLSTSNTTTTATVAAITHDGKLYMWGENQEENIIPSGTFPLEAGIEDEFGDILKPIQLEIGSRVNYVSPGSIFTIAATEDGEVKYWGSNDLKPPAKIEPDWHKNCSNPASLVTLTGWEDETDYLKIYGLTRTGQLTEKPICYDRANLIRFMSGNAFADWIPRPDPETPGEFLTIDVSGHGGKPGKLRFYRIISGEFVSRASFSRLRDPSTREYVIKPRLLNQRVGNIKGTFGIGQHHGQSPGFTIFSLMAKTE